MYGGAVPGTQKKKKIQTHTHTHTIATERLSGVDIFTCSCFQDPSVVVNGNSECEVLFCGLTFLLLSDICWWKLLRLCCFCHCVCVCVACVPARLCGRADRLFYVSQILTQAAFSHMCVGRIQMALQACTNVTLIM